MPNYILGKDGKLYYHATALTAGANSDYATKLSTATELTNVQDVNTNLTKDTVELPSRANGGWKTKVGTLKDGTVTFSMLWKPGDANFEAFRDAYLDDDEIAVFVLDQDKATTGSQGIAGNFNVINFSRGEPIAGAMTADVELSPSSFTGWYEKTA